MKIAAFLQLRNELSNGHLMRCLNNVQQWADSIFIYDDNSTDDSYTEYLKYTSPSRIIRATERKFKRELFNKKELLELTLKSNPDWILWLDGDSILDANLTKNLRGIAGALDSAGIEGGRAHNINLWRHEAFFRLDNQYNSCNPLMLWRNTGKLRYNPVEGLHGQQFPDGIGTVASIGNILHYGFASEEWIVRKYKLYKSMGQTGWALDRLIDEKGLQLAKVAKELYPKENLPVDYDTVTPLTPKIYEVN